MALDRIGMAIVLGLAILCGRSGVVRADAESPDPAALQGPTKVEVSLTDRLRFEPSPVEIHVGEIVEWKNVSVLVHTVTGDPSLAQIEGSALLPPGAEAFNSGNLVTQASYRHRFDVPGTYQVFCIPHEATGMTGTIIVHAAKPGAPE